MKLVHAQMTLAVLALLLVGSLLWAFGQRSRAERLAGEKASLETKLEEARREKPPGPRAEPKDSSEVRMLRETNERLRQDLDRLTRENAHLKEALARAGAGGSSGPKPMPGAPPQPFAGPDGPPGPPPAIAPPPSPRGEPWGASAPSEIDELAQVLQLTGEQREHVRLAIVEGQNEFERRLIEAGQRGERDIGALERIGQEVSERTEQRIEQLLYPEQKQAFREYMRRLEER